jgi:hypothetical protein
MNKKIKITEAQYNRLINLMVETPFDVMTKSSIQNGDVISITWKGSKNNFKVINNASGQITMDNIDKGSTNINYRYFMVYTSLDGDDLELRRAHKTKEADKLDDQKKWANVTVKDITDIQVIRDGKVIDRVDPVSPSAAKQQKQGNTGTTESNDFITDINNNLTIILEQLIEGKGLKLILNNAEVIFCCNKKTGGVFDLEIIENKSIPELNKWQTFVLDIKGNPNDSETSIYEANKDIVKTPDNGKTFSLKFKVITSDKESEVWVIGGQGVAITKSCEDKTDDDIEDNEEVNTKEEEELKLDAKEAFEKILADPMIQKAFYSQPTFWQSFVAELKGKKHPGNGIITVLNIVKNYEYKQIIEQIGEGFSDKKGDIVEFKPLKPTTINYNAQKEGRKEFTLQTLKPTEIKTSADKRETGLVLEVNLPQDPNYILRVIVDGKTETENIKECRLIIGRLTSNNVFTAVSKPITTELEFLNSDGYKIPKKENIN